MSIRLSIILAALIAMPAWAQDASWPNKPIRFIVPFPPGAAVDGVARLMGQQLSTRLGQQLVIDNRVHKHPSLGEMTVSDWLWFMIRHTERHLEQVKEVIRYTGN